MKKVVIGVVLMIVAVNYVIYMRDIVSPGPKCLVDSCDHKAMEGCEFCKMHHNAGMKGYHKCGEITSIRNRANSTYEPDTSSVNTNNTSGNTSSNKTSTTKKPSSTKKPSGSNKGYDTHNSYDAGYEDVYENDDYDWDRYYSDDDYANGVDDAMDELDW